MKKIFSLIFATVAVIGITSCNENTIEEGLNTNQPSIEKDDSNALYLFATIDNGEQTRVSMTDNDTTVNFAWEVGDEIRVVVNGTTYTYKYDEESSRFVCKGDAPAYESGTEYTATFGTETPSSSQDNVDNSFNCDESLRLEAKFTYDENSETHLNFKGKYPIITIVKDGVNSSDYSGDVVFHDGINSYEAQGTITNGKLTANIVIRESSGDRYLTFKLMGTNPEEVKVCYFVPTAKAYLPKVRYKADFTGKESYATFPADFDFRTLDPSLKGNATWNISGDTIDNDFRVKFRDDTAIKNISINCPNVVTIPKEAFQLCKELISVSFPNATIVNEKAFYLCDKLKNINIPNAEIIGVSAFQDCKVLTDINFPKVTELADEAFRGCSVLNNINFPELKTIGIRAFHSCHSLETVEFLKVETINERAFRLCTTISEIKLPNTTKIGVYAFKDVNALTSVYLTTATDITIEKVTEENGLTVYPFGSIQKKCTLHLSAANYDDIIILEDGKQKWGGTVWNSIVEEN